MSENPYQPPYTGGVGVPSRPSRYSLHPLGLTIVAVTAFFVHALATKVPTRELQILGSPWLAATLALMSFSVLVFCLVFIQQCRRLNRLVELLYLLAPVAMYAYIAYRILAG